MTTYGLYINSSMRYPSGGVPFRPHEAYPEYLFGAEGLSPERNTVYEGVRELLRLSGLDAGAFGTPRWNPLGSYIRPGMRVLVKPNLVMHENPSGYGTDCLYTHPSIIAAVIDYVAVALRGEGSIVLADAPMQSCDWDALVRGTGLGELAAWYRSFGLDVELKDLRGLRSVRRGAELTQEVVEGAKGCVVDLGETSSFFGFTRDKMERLRITNYDPAELAAHHTVGRHEYLISQELLDADVVVNLPKAKTHRKAGMTGALKNMVGVNVRKEFLPHHTAGSAVEGADEYERRSALRRASAAVADKRNAAVAKGSAAQGMLWKLSAALGRAGMLASGDATSEGSWWGNDTIWRTVLDLNKIVFHADRNGVMCDEPQRCMVVVCDMVTIGQGEGPLLPEPSEWGALAFCDDPTAHDVAMARLMGSDASLIPVIREAVAYRGAYSWGSDARSFVCRSNSPRFDGWLGSEMSSMVGSAILSTSGWEGHFARGSN